MEEPALENQECKRVINILEKSDGNITWIFSQFLPNTHIALYGCKNQGPIVQN